MKPIRIGITGGIGSGKSIVAKCLEKMGFPVFNADREAAALLCSESTVVNQVKIAFGENAYLPSGLPNKDHIASLVFSNPSKLQELNSIIHPAVSIRFEDWCRQNSQSKFVFKEAAILFESGADSQVHKVIGVIAPMEIRISRVMQRDGKTRAQIEKVIQNQLPQKELISKCNFIIQNDDKHPVLPALLEILDQLSTTTKRIDGTSGH